MDNIYVTNKTETMKYTTKTRYSIIKVGTCNDCSGFLPIKQDKCSECTEKRSQAIIKALEAGFIF